ncbi:MAG TPA: STAS domain-containing protein [Gemmataceae bacterium]|nr:STAS domain-containing protein [Gemmataceae bacterium]
MKLRLVASEAGVTRIESADDITVFDFANGATPLEALLGPDCHNTIVLLDLGKSSYIDSSGVGWLMHCHSRFQKAGGRLVVHSIPPMVNHCFRVLGMYDVMQIAADEEAALKMAAEPNSLKSHGTTK